MDMRSDKRSFDSMSVVVCTHTEGRWTTLTRAVSAVVKQMNFDDELLVVVDHNEPLLARCREAMGECMVVPNRHSRGLSGARNTALDEARGSIIVFLDDDAVPLDGWLDALRRPYSDPHVYGVGGLTLAHWPDRRPVWFPEEFLWVVGCSHRGLPSGQHRVRNLLGANMSFRRSAFECAGGFVETMGRVGGRPLGCEETEFCIRFTQMSPSALLLHDPAARVEHYVSQQRTSLGYFVRRCWAEGLSKAEVSRRVGSSSALSTERHYVSRVLPLGIWRGLRDSVAGNFAGAARLAAIILGLAVTTAGYYFSTLRSPRAVPGGGSHDQAEVSPHAGGAGSTAARPAGAVAHAPATAVADERGVGAGPEVADERGVGAGPEIFPDSRRIRVLVVTARFFPDMGGIETHTYEVTSRLAQREDLDVTVLATDRSGRLPAREDLGGFTVLRCRSYPARRDYYLAPSLHRLILAGGYDLVHCQGIHTAVPVAAMIAAQRRRIPYVVTLHTGGHSSGLRNQLRGMQWRALGPLLRRAALVVAVSRFEQRVFEETCRLEESRFRIIQNGGDVGPSAVQAKPVPGRIVSCGRLERYKGHQHVIEALPAVRERIPDATLLILGTGSYEQKLRTLVKRLSLEDAVIIEYIPSDRRDRMAELLGGAAVLAALSEYEAHPVAVMEALALGTPVVGFDTAGIADLVEDGLVQGVPKDASPETIAQALVAVLEQDHMRCAPSLPTWDLAAAELARIYRDVAGVPSQSSARS